MRKYLQKVPILNKSGFKPPKLSHIPPLKRQNYYTDESVGMSGDRPKDFVKVYEFGEANCYRDKPKTWIPYLAKVGDKRYPSESITEYLLNRLGEVLGVNMAKSKLYIVDNQIRFFSRFFLSENEQLVHGSQIYATYLRDEEFVKKVERERLERTFFTFQFAEQAIRFYSPANEDVILQDFVKMLIFDALIGNNDRHFYNWGVIVDLENKRMPRFSPIFDTARGVFWNDTEEKLMRVMTDAKTTDNFITSYVKNATPKIGWDNETKINHLQLIQFLRTHCKPLTLSAESIFKVVHKEDIKHLLQDEFSPLLPIKRLELIQKCLLLRYHEIEQIFLNS
jgi:hypothetical protein